ncbi:MAG TPA: leucine-rich repeat domain-containing protein, partial [Chloroflexia bacterium]|nr:leucine-rich repeat domain-containing protein [Chloroflexia bacterium]
MFDGLESLLRAAGRLQPGESLPDVDEGPAGGTQVGVARADDAVIAFWARYCALTALPDSVGDLVDLQQLDLTGNQLTALPDTLAGLADLRTLALDDNQLT